MSNIKRRVLRQLCFLILPHIKCHYWNDFSSVLVNFVMQPHLYVADYSSSCLLGCEASRLSPDG